MSLWSQKCQVDAQLTLAGTSSVKTRAGQASGPRVALVGPTDRPANGLGAPTQGKGPGGLDSLVLGDPGPGSPGHGLGGLGGVLGPPSLDFFPACAVQDRGGSLMKGKR